MISIIIPSYNETGRIKGTVEKALEIDLEEEHEVIVVDDGSNDDTAKEAEEAGADEVVSYQPNRGKGHAMRKGAEKAQGEKLIFIDADQHHMEKVPEFMDQLRENTLVVGKRDFSKMPWTRRINNSLAKLAFLLATGRNVVKDPICGIRAMYKEDFQDLDLKQDGFEVESEINLKALKKGMKFTYIPITIHYSGKAFEFNELDPGKSIKLAHYLIKSVLKSWKEKLHP